MASGSCFRRDSEVDPDHATVGGRVLSVPRPISIPSHLLGGRFMTSVRRFE